MSSLFQGKLVPITTATTTAIAHGILDKIIFNDTSIGTVKIYDGAVTADNLKGTLAAGILKGTTVHYGARMVNEGNSINIVTSAADNLTIVVQ